MFDSVTPMPGKVQTITKTKTELANLLVLGLAITTATVMGGIMMAAVGLSSSADFKAAGGKGGGGGKPQPSALVVSIAPDADQTVPAGSQNQTFSRLVLDASTLKQAVEVSEIDLTVTTDGIAPNLVSGFRFYDDLTSTVIGTSNEPDADVSSKTNNGDSAVVKFVFTSPVSLAAGASRTFTARANVSIAATTGVYQVGLADIADLEEVVIGVAKGKTPEVSYQYSNGPQITFSDAPKLIITRDSQSPSAALVPANTQGVTLAIFDVLASNENVRLEELYLTAMPLNDGGWDQIIQINLYNGSTLLGSATPTATDSSGNTVLVNLTSPLVVPQDGLVLIVVKADTADSNYELGSNGASGQGLVLKINSAGDVTARGEITGSLVTPENITVTNAVGAPMYLFRTVPIVTPNDQLSGGVISGVLPSGTTAGVDLYKFKITADGAGDIGLLTVAFLVNTSTATATDLGIYDGGTKIASAGRMVHITDGHQTDSVIYTFVFTTDGLALAASSPDTSKVFPSQSIIQANNSKVYTLKGTLVCNSDGLTSCSGSSGSGSVSVQLLGDNTVLSTLPTTADVTTAATMAYARSIQWTDFWRTLVLGRASTTATVTEQWTNGYLVKDSTGNNLAPTSTAVIFSR